MRLKSIKLAGFKSFVDPTTVYFPSNLCGVVGPNGCGKSNIIDAVRWVMGESSAKHLRGESMTDVIFKGSNSRKPAGRASVELVFDNNEGRVTGEYAAYNEISIKRSLTSDTKNTYYLNGNKCRRRDIMDVFMGTGLGPRSYAIISQGIISNLIESKPEELRVFIEEAAGISKYKERRRETESRIRRTKENLERLADLRGELGRQLGHLEQQAKAAEKYKQYRAEERLKKAQLSALRWRTLSQGANSQEQAIRELEVQYEAAVSRQRSADAGMEEDRVTQMELGDSFHESQSKYYGTGNEVTRIEETIRHQVERSKELTNDLALVEESWQEVREQLAVDQEQFEVFQAEQLELEPELEMLQAQEESSGDRLAAAEEAMHCWQQEWDHFNQSSHEPRRIAEVEQSRIQHAEQVLGRMLERQTRLNEELEALGGDEDQAEMDAVAEKLTELELSREVIEIRLEEVSADIELKRADLQTLGSQLDLQKTELNTVLGREASLEALKQAAIGQDVGTINWMEEHHLHQNVRLVEKLKVVSGWEKAVETVLGDVLHAVCVDEFDDVVNLLDSLEQGALTLIESVSAVGHIDNRLGKLELLAEKVKEGLAGSAALHGVYVAETLEEGLVYRKQLEPGESIITRDGLWLSLDWIKVSRLVDSSVGVLEQQQELELLKHNIEKLELVVDEQKVHQEQMYYSLEVLETEKGMLQQQQTDLNRKYGEARAEHAARQVKLEQFSVRRSRLKQEVSECQEQYNAEQEIIYESRLKLQEALDIMEQDVDRKDQLQEERETHRSGLEAIKQQSSNDNDRTHQLALKQQNIIAQLSSIKSAIERLSQQAAKLKERREFLLESLSQANSPETVLQDQLEELLARRLEEEMIMQHARTALEEVEQRIRESEKIRQAAERQAEQFRGQLEKLRMDWQSMDVRKASLAEQLKEEEFDLGTVLENLPDDAVESVWELEMERLHAKIERLGAINLAAIEEYESQSERKSYLDAQDEDLTSALNTLENAIKKIDSETRQRFKSTFDKVNSGLKDLFPKVFGGGQAHLRLTGEDMLNTGVTIMAQPPGKKNSTIYLLSGGEKALTAIALVFAIFQLNPAPFCMLDEVDAPLDDSNVGRYAKLVKEMSDRVQFIFITHNKIAMQAANQLIGVTMHEAGVSRPVSVDIEQAATLGAL
ncbi:MAG: chromosome segregation protein SMC [Candidatus Endonucleobacter bathymodioli]|uniref:Chromosome partition protein Smc n=1 Tax=Candidatus Endonucleibacter bathymodioli TaxID=539814 RepID=A0AA90NKL5_9GAMM|nr:chromosome segregation protein SMC [Candidatus Endonucleobacter bathymodioli]